MTDIFRQLGLLWADRAPREQLLLSVLALILGAIIVWYGLVAPVKAFRSDQHRAYVSAVERYRTIESGIARYEAASSNQTRASLDDRPVRTIVTESAFASGIPLARLTPGEAGRIDVWIETVSAPDLLRWLDNLQSRAGIYVVRANLDREASGLVSAQLVLQGAE